MVNAAAAPATVSGEPLQASHWDPSREGQQEAKTREPGDLPSNIYASPGGVLRMRLTITGGTGIGRFSLRPTLI